MPRSGALVIAVTAVVCILWRPAHAADPPAKVVAALEKIVPGIAPDKIQMSVLPGRAVGVRGTPSLILENGQLVPGYVPPLELLEILERNTTG